MRPRFALLFAPVLACALAAGCGSIPSSPTAPALTASVPTPTPSPTNPTAPSSPATLASLSIEDAYAIAGTEWTCNSTWCQSGTKYVDYEVRFLARESSGRSGARIYTVVVNNPQPRPGDSTREVTDDKCWVEPIRVSPGGMQDVFYTDAGASSLGYCALYIQAAPNVPRLDLEVHFVDDADRGGAAFATISRFRQR